MPEDGLHLHSTRPIRIRLRVYKEVKHMGGDINVFYDALPLASRKVTQESSVDEQWLSRIVCIDTLKIYYRVIIVEIGDTS